MKKNGLSSMKNLDKRIILSSPQIVYMCLCKNCQIVTLNQNKYGSGLSRTVHHGWSGTGIKNINPAIPKQPNITENYLAIPLSFRASVASRGISLKKSLNLALILDYVLCFKFHVSQ